MNRHLLRNNEILQFRERAVSATQISIVIVDASAPDQPIVDVNPAFERLTGYSFKEAVGRNCRFLQGPLTDPDAVRVIRKGIRDGTETSVTIQNYRKDGTPFWNDIHISPIVDDAGSITHFVGVQSDVTGRKHLQDSQDVLLRASEILTVTEQPDDALVRIAQTVVPTFADVCIAYLQDEPQGSNSASPPRLVAVEDRFDSSGRLRQALKAHEEEIANELHGIGWVLRTGETRWIPRLSGEDLGILTTADGIHPAILDLKHRSLIITPLASSTSIYGCLVVLMSDSRREFSAADEKLVRDLGRRAGEAIDNIRLFEHAQGTIRARDQFLSIVAHELRTPVVSIKGYAQFLLRSLDRGNISRDRLRQSLGTIEASVHRLSSLTDDLISVSRRNLDHLPLRREQVNIRDYLQEFFAETGPAAQKGYQTDINIASGDAVVSADTERLHQVLTILLSNAVKFSPPDELVYIAAESDGEGVTITVSDLGIGLFPGEETTIFEPFGRTEAAIKSNLPGLGMSLFIARTIVERHGGRIWAESEGQNMGTSIGVWLPLATIDLVAEE